jgi:septal ring factor EnvC (AmiA/AmiB activator)
VVNAFGKHPLPDLPDVMYDNPGIDAVVGKGEQAKAVYAGTVSGVYSINGFGTVVLINHGEYFTVYGHIASASVSKGQEVKQGQSLGTLFSDPDDGGRTTIHFEVWKGRTKLNPQEWIR